MTLYFRHILPVLLWSFSFCLSAQNSVAHPMQETVEATDTIAAAGTGGLSDTIDISILTCTPGQDLYAKFGHTALRVKCPARQIDAVFNYGCFDYRVENFVLKFVLGQTDYRLEAETFDFFLQRYRHYGIGVTEQRLNLTQQEAGRLFSMLLENLLPMNQEYRYQWLGNNCTNKVMYLMERLVEEEHGEVRYDTGDGEWEKSVRDLLHEKLSQDPWTSFGIDMLLGHEIDNTFRDSLSPSSRLRVNMFLPSVFSHEADQATILLADGTQKPYVAEKQELLAETLAESSSFWFTPLVTFSLILCLVIGLSVWDLRRGQASVWLDATLSAIQGLTGILIAFLFFFSEHPGVDSNWLVIIFNPLPLLYAGWTLVCHHRQFRNRWAFTHMAVLGLFMLLMPVCPQVFAPAMYIVVLTLLARAITYYIFERRQQPRR